MKIEIGKWYEPKANLKHLAVSSGNIHGLARRFPVEIFAVARGYVLAAHAGCAPFVFVADRFLEHFQLCGENQTANIIETFKFSGKPKNQISGDFLRRFQSAGCQCGKQKLENFALCGVCFSRLPNDLKNTLRRAKGTELEEAYNFAVKSLKDGRKSK